MSVRISQMTKQTVHVIMATFNPGDHLQEQLESILGQHGVSVKVTIFDDGSTNREALERLSDVMDPRVSLVDCRPSGSAGKNFLRAIAAWDGPAADWISFSDQDDIWHEDKLFEGISYAKSQNADGYSSNLSIYDGSDITGVLAKSPKQKKYDHFFQGASAGCTYILKNSLFGKVNQIISTIDVQSLDKHISHDWLVYFISRMVGSRWAHDEKSYIFYRQHDSNVYGAKRGVFGAIARVSLLKDGHAICNSELISEICNIRGIVSPILQRENFFKRLLFCRNMFHFRRESLYSPLAYILWLLGQYYPYSRADKGAYRHTLRVKESSQVEEDVGREQNRQEDPKKSWESTFR